MNDLIIYGSDGDNPTVSGRELHMFLEIETPYTKWFSRMCEYGFEEGKDFWTKMSESTGGRPSTDHIMTIDMAKELCMLARNDKGKEARQYFLEVEREWNSPEKVMARALKMAEQQLKSLTATNTKLTQKIEEDKPKVLFAEALHVSDKSILVGELAKILRQNGIDIGQNRLFEWLRQNGYLIKAKGEAWNDPTQKSMDLGLFEIKKTTAMDANNCVVTRKTTKVTVKGQEYFVNKFLSELVAA